MQHATWLTIERSPIALQLYRLFRRMPDGARAPVRWLVAPCWNAAAALVRYLAGERVMSGPFAGTELELTQTSRRNLLGYLLGTQELELAEVVETIVARDYPDIVNLGVADGYYALGLARRMPRTRIVGFEQLTEHHDPLWRAARRNGVADRITLRGHCAVDDLARELGARELGARELGAREIGAREIGTARGPVLVVADIEGGERDLIDPSRVEGLRSADILVETHDGLVPGCTATLIERFAGTHDIERIAARPRVLSDFPGGPVSIIARLAPVTAVELMNERRGIEQEWLFMTARDRPAAARGDAMHQTERDAPCG